MFAKRTNRGLSHRFENERRDRIRSESFVFRPFEPAIDEMAIEIEKGKTFNYQDLGESLSASDETLPWKPGEFIGAKIVAGLMGIVGVYLFTRFVMGYGPTTCVIMAIVCGLGYVLIALANVKNNASKRRKVIKRSFAAAIDLMALMMEVGGNFQESLQVVARENSGKAIGDELSLIVNDIEMGKPRKAALEAFASRMNDDDISEIVFACNESEDLGVPIAETLKTQADRIRIKRTAWAEKAAQEAEVTMVFPSMLTMIACLITVCAPFILQGVNQFFGP